MISSKKDRYQFIKQLTALDERLLFIDTQRTTYRTNRPNLDWWDFKKYCKLKKCRDFLSHDELLRTGISTDYLNELRIDIDYKIDGKKSKSSAIETMFQINKALNQIGIKIFWYSSGGAGIHGKCLINWGNVPKDTNRHNFNKALLDYAGLTELRIKDIIDNQALSNKTMLTLEGAKKRNGGTQYNTFIDLEKYSTLEEVKKLLISTKFSFQINFEFLTKINCLETETINKILQMQDEIKDLIDKDIDNVKTSVTSDEIVPCNNLNYDPKYDFIVDAIISLFHEKNITSKENKFNKFSLYVLKILFHFVKDKSHVLPISQEIFKRLKINIPLDKKVISAHEHYKNHGVNLNYFENNKLLITEQEFYSKL